MKYTITTLLLCGCLCLAGCAGGAEPENGGERADMTETETEQSMETEAEADTEAYADTETDTEAEAEAETDTEEETETDGIISRRSTAAGRFGRGQIEQNF